MSNLLLNLRVGCFHLQVSRDRPWMPAIRYNDAWKGRRMFRPFVQLH